MDSVADGRAAVAPQAVRSMTVQAAAARSWPVKIPATQVIGQACLAGVRQNPFISLDPNLPSQLARAKLTHPGEPSAFTSVRSILGDGW